MLRKLSVLLCIMVVVGVCWSADLNHIPTDPNGKPGAVLVGNNGNKVTVNSDGSIDVSVTGIVASSPTASVTIYPGQSLPVIDVTYDSDVSSGTAGKLIATGNISLTGDMDSYMFYARGGNVDVTGNWFGGVKYVLQGIPFKPNVLSKPVTDPIFQCVLPAGTTLYYDTNILVSP